MNSKIYEFNNQVIPLLLTGLTCIVLVILLFLFIQFLNLFSLSTKIIPQLRLGDIIVGLTIYLKTSVDFAIFIGNLMKKYSGIKNRIAIEIGTATGNAIGTLFVLTIWTFFKEVPLLMILMIFLASLVLFNMAEEGMKEAAEKTHSTIAQKLYFVLHQINKLFSPIIRYILPPISPESSSKKTFLSLLLFAITIPLILGLDDFAGYIPLFNIVNVFGFAVGVLMGHMLLNIALFASPRHTESAVKQPLIALLGSIAFLGIGLWGFVEIYRLLIHLF